MAKNPKGPVQQEKPDLPKSPKTTIWWTPKRQSQT